MSGWQPIETLPMDNTRVYLGDRENVVIGFGYRNVAPPTIAKFHGDEISSSDGFRTSTISRRAYTEHMPNPRAGEVVSEGYARTIYYGMGEEETEDLDFTPTHWMPLRPDPEPPR